MDTKSFNKVWKEREKKRDGTYVSKKDKQALYRQEMEMKYGRKNVLSYRFLKHTGAFITILSVGLTIVILFPIFTKTNKRKVVVVDPYRVVETPTPKKENIAIIVEEAQGYGLETEFSVAIPKISAYSNVVENVDPNNSVEYLDALKQGIAHTKGTYFPGLGKNIYLFSHSTASSADIQKYNAIFYNLKDLDIDDQIIVFFRQEKFIYHVSEVVVVGADDTSYIYKDFGKETLVLQTCDPPGTTWRRLLVIAQRV